MWTIQKIVSKGDYNYALVQGHPYATKNGYVLEHRIVIENTLGRLLTSEEIVHHRDGNKKNNDPKNLELMCRKDHARHHGLTRGRKTVLLICPWCSVQFVQYHSKTFLVQKSQYTCCSRSCRGKFSREAQLHGISPDMMKAINKNVVKIYRAESSIG